MTATSLVVALGAVLVPSPIVAETASGRTQLAMDDVPSSAGLGDPVWPRLGNGGYTVVKQRLSFRFSDSLVRYTARTTLHGRATERLTSFNLDLLGPQVTGVEVDGRSAKWRTTRAGELVMTPPRILRAGDRFRVQVDVRNRVPMRRTMKAFPPGLLRGGQWVQMMAQPSGARRALAVSDHPAQKAPTTIAITAPTRLGSVANGRLVDSWRAGDRTTRVFHGARRLAPELLQVGVGPFTLLQRRGPHGVALRFAVPADQAAAIRPQLRSFDRSIRWLERRLGRFPGDVAGAYATPLGGELETQGLTLLKASQLMPDPFEANGVEAIVLHEVAHEWFGNSVSPRQWSDLWLNEGHAVFYEMLWSARERGRSLAASMRAAYEGMGNTLLERGPIADPDPTAWRGREAAMRPYGSGAYHGGALALFALREEVGKSTFRAIERAWVRRYDDSMAGTAAFVALASRVAGRDLAPFLASWLHRDRLPAMPGHPGWKVADR